MKSVPFSAVDAVHLLKLGKTSHGGVWLNADGNDTVLKRGPEFESVNK